MQRRHHDPGIARVDVCGAAYVVVTGEPLLRGLERCAGRPITEGNYCWTGECGHCEVVYLAGGRPRAAMACLLPAFDGMRLSGLSRYLQIDLGR
jgi:hypothetical protein